MITIQFTEDEFETVLANSTTFRFLVARQLAAAQATLANANEPVLLSNFKTLVKSSVRFDNKIQWIKNTRQWAVDNKATLSADTYNNLYSLAGAKHFVEDIMGLPRY